MTDTQSNPNRLRILRHDELTYVTTSQQEHEQFRSLLLGDINPEQCVWTVQPVKLDWRAFSPKRLATDRTQYIITNRKEMEQFYEVATGVTVAQNHVWTITHTGIYLLNMGFLAFPIQP